MVIYQCREKLFTLERKNKLTIFPEAKIKVVVSGSLYTYSNNNRLTKVKRWRTLQNVSDFNRLKAMDSETLKKSRMCQQKE